MRDRTRKSADAACVDGSEGSDNYIRPSFLPTSTSDWGCVCRVPVTVGELPQVTQIDGQMTIVMSKTCFLEMAGLLGELADYREGRKG